MSIELYLNINIYEMLRIDFIYIECLVSMRYFNESDSFNFVNIDVVLNFRFDISCVILIFLYFRVFLYKMEIYVFGN